MLILFVFSFAGLIYIFVGYPVLLWFLSLLFRKQVNQGDVSPNISLIISAYNEEDVIRQKIENSLELNYPEEKLEIIVASESNDCTNKIVAEYEDRGVILYAYENREGKPATLYRTVPKAKGDIVVFSDANAMFGKDAIKKLARNFNDERIGCVSGRLRYVNPKGSSIGKGESTYWEYDFILKMMATRMFALGGISVNGSIFAIRKELYAPINKFRGDDFEISCGIEIKGYGVIMEPEAVSYEESSENSKQEFKRKVRLATWNLKSSLLLLGEALRMRRWLTALLVFSHRFLRYTTPVWLIALFLSNYFLLSSSLFYLFVLQLLFYSLAFLGLVLEKSDHKIHSVLLIPLYFCMVNCAAFLGLVKNIFKRTEVLWEKAR